MKTTKIIFLSALLFSAPSFAAKDEIKPSIGLSFSQIGGVATENVYEGNRKISQLVWEIKRVKMLGLNAAVDYNDFRIKGEASINVDNGSDDATMVDSDWLGGAGFNGGNTNDTNWTDRSWHKVQMEEAHNFDASLAYQLLPNLYLGVGYRQTHFEWSDLAGDYVYTDSTFRDTVGNFGNIPSITYRQSFKIPYIGVELDQPITKKFRINLSAKYSNIASATSRDHHILRSLTIKSDFQNVEYYGLGAGFEYNFTQNLGLGFGYEFNEVPETRGDAKYSYSSGTSFACLDCASLSNKYEKFSVFLKYFFDSSKISNLF